MIKLFNKIKEKFRVKKVDKLGVIQEKHKMSMDDILKIYEEYRDKSIKEGIYYLKGSPYMLEIIEKYPNPEMIEDFFLAHCNRLDSKEPAIPLEIGQKIEALTKDSSIRLGMHRSDSIIGEDYLSSSTLHSIMEEGLINNGAAMQGLISPRVEPNQSLRNTDDMITAFSVIKNSFRGSQGAILVGLPRELINSQFEVINQEDEKIYDVDTYGIKHIKPEFIIGYISTYNGEVKFYSREEILQNKKEL